MKRVSSVAKEKSVKAEAAKTVAKKVVAKAEPVKTEEFKQEELTELSDQIKKQEEAVKFLRLLLDNQVKSFTWDVRNAIEQLKLESN